MFLKIGKGDLGVKRCYSTIQPVPIELRRFCLLMPILGLSNMHPQPQPAKPNMHPCILCGKNQLSHNQTAKEKQPKPKKQPNPQTNLWQP
jgi:hypothetical protein